MQQHHAIIGEQLGASLEKCVVVVDADMLEHADRDDAVERAVDVAIILQHEFCRTRQTSFFRPCIRDLQLLGGEGDAGDIGAYGLCEIDAKAAPAAADVENAQVAIDQELRGDVALLSKLGVLGAVRPASRNRRSCIDCRVEEERIEVGVEIVVTCDILP